MASNRKTFQVSTRIEDALLHESVRKQATEECGIVFTDPSDLTVNNRIFLARVASFNPDRPKTDCQNAQTLYFQVRFTEPTEYAVEQILALTTGCTEAGCKFCGSRVGNFVRIGQCEQCDVFAERVYGQHQYCLDHYLSQLRANRP